MHFFLLRAVGKNSSESALAKKSTCSILGALVVSKDEFWLPDIVPPFVLYNLECDASVSILSFFGKCVCVLRPSHSFPINGGEVSSLVKAHQNRDMSAATVLLLLSCNIGK